MEGGLLATSVEVVAADGLTLTPQALHGLAASGGMNPRRRWTGDARRDDYGGRFLVVPGQQPGLRLVTVVDLADRHLTFRTYVDGLQGTGDSPSAIRLRVRGWAGTSQLEAPGARVRSETSARVAAERTWDVRWDNSAPAARSLVLSGRLPLEELLSLVEHGLPHAGIPLPEVELLGVPVIERWIM